MTQRTRETSFGDSSFPLSHPKAESVVRLKAEAGGTLPPYIYIPTIYHTLREAEQRVRDGGVAFLRSEHPSEVRMFSGVFDTFTLSQKNIKDARDAFVAALHRIMVLSPHAPAYEHSGLTMLAYIQTYNPFPIRDYYKYACILRAVGEDIDAPGCKKSPTETEILDLFREYHRHNERFLQYCATWGYETDDVLRALSFSLWEGVAGDKAVVTRDAHSKNRYHVFHFGSHTTRGASRYTFAIEGSGDALHVACTATSDEKATTEKAMPESTREHLVGAYESLCHFLHLEDDVPFMEAVVRHDGSIAVLQSHLHNTARYEVHPPALPESIRNEREGWQKASFVHGITAGIQRITFTRQSGKWEPGTEEFGAVIGNEKDAPRSFMGMCSTYIALKVPDRTTLVETHGAVNQAMMPFLSITAPAGFLDTETTEEATVDIISNGTDAYVRLVERVRAR